jgi:uncharacterized membrane protein
MQLLDVLTFLGHLHPLIVHLPIGFLLLAALLNLLTYHKRYIHVGHAVPFILLLGFIAAILSCLFGFIQAGSGDYDQNQLNSHKIAGLALTLLSGILCAGMKKIPARVFTFLLLIMTAIMTYGGHLGGGLTHGSDYLSLSIISQTARTLPANPDSALVFEDIIHPILEKKCAQCHQGSKTKGNLSVQSLQTLLKGGKHGPAVLPGRLTESQLYKRITLDPSDEKFMPSDGKPSLTKQEMAVIIWWIEKGNASEGVKMSAFKNGAPPVEEDSGSALMQHVNPEIPATFNASLVDNLRKKGWVVRIMLQSPAMLDVTLPAGAHRKPDDLSGLEKHIVWLNLSDNGFRDGDLAFLKQLSNLEKLRLEKNPLTDSISGDLVTLRHLEAVNLNETKLTDEGLARLKKNPSLKRIYTWKTGVRQQ